jgi:hypothetical protein
MTLTIGELRAGMDSELKNSVLPVLRKLGFKGSMPHLRRERNNGMDLLTFQFDKWGGGFVVEIARCGNGGFTTYWGKHIPASKMTA